MLKRVITVIFVLVITMTCSASVFAEEEDIPAENPVQVEYQYISSVSTSLNIRSGKAYVTVSVNDSNNNATNIEITAYLQKKSGDEWVNVATWKKSGNVRNLVLTGSKNISSGTYRAKNVTRAYHNSKKETITTYSASKAA